MFHAAGVSVFDAENLKVFLLQIPTRLLHVWRDLEFLTAPQSGEKLDSTKRERGRLDDLRTPRQGASVVACVYPPPSCDGKRERLS